MAVMRTPQEHIETQGSAIDDTLTPTDHDANAVDLHNTVDYICSQIADMLGEASWETAPDETIAALAARAKLEDTLAETEEYLLTDTTIPSSVNYKVLSVAGSEVPVVVKAIATNIKGLVTAQHSGSFGSSHSLAELAGDTTINPRNLLQVADASSGDPLLSSARVIWGLLQHESGATDNALFTDITPERAQVSFVRYNSTHDDLEACPVADIEDAIINLSFVNRKSLSTRTPQDWMRRGSFVDVSTGAASVTLDNAIDNQGATPSTQATNTEWRIDDDVDLTFETSDGGRTLLGISPAAAGDVVTINADTLDVNVGAGGTVDIDNGVTVDSGGTPINLGVTAGQIDAGAAALKLASSGAAVEVEGVGVTVDGAAGAGGPIAIDGTLLDADFSGDGDSHIIIDPNSATKRTLLIAARNAGAEVADLELEADGDILFESIRETSPLPLDDASAGAISAVGSGSHASIAAAIKDAYESGGVDLTFKFFTLTSNYGKDVNVPAATLDLTSRSINWASSPNTFLFLQGRLIHGASGADVGDVYPGSTPASGDLKFSYPGGVKNGWKLFTISLLQ
jgi:hypothetical protein